MSNARIFATWCVMNHARPALVSALRAWGLQEPATAIERATSLAALKILAAAADAEIRRKIVFVPLRRDLSHAVTTLQAAITFATRGDAENAAAVVIGVFTNAASALSWRRPWTRLSWRARRAQVIATARQEQQAYLDAQSGQSPSEPG
jgi:hypothetical protein